MIGTFPYSYIPGFMVPLAVVLHLLALRALTSPAPILTPASATV